MGLFSNVDLSDIFGMGDPESDYQARSDQRNRALGMLSSPFPNTAVISPWQGADYMLKQILGNANLNSSNRYSHNIEGQRQQNYLDAIQNAQPSAETSDLGDSPLKGVSNLGSGTPNGVSSVNDPMLRAVGGITDPSNYAKRLGQIENSGRFDNSATGSNKGYGQFGPQEEAKYGINDSNRTDQSTQYAAIGKERAEVDNIFSNKFGQPASDAGAYFAHQQGHTGGPELIANPDKPAWEVVRKYYPSDKIAKQAISGNIPANSPLKNIPVEQVKAGDFTKEWANFFNKGSGTAVGGNSPPVDPRASMAPPMGIGLGKMPIQEAPIDNSGAAPPAPPAPAVSAPPAAPAAPPDASAAPAAPTTGPGPTAPIAGVPGVSVGASPGGPPGAASIGGLQSLDGQSAPSQLASAGIDPGMLNAGGPVAPQDAAPQSGATPPTADDNGVTLHIDTPPPPPPLSAKELHTLSQSSPEDRQSYLQQRAGLFTPIYQETGYGKFWSTPTGKHGFISEPKMGKQKVGDTEIETATVLDPTTHKLKTYGQTTDGQWKDINSMQAWVSQKEADKARQVETSKQIGAMGTTEVETAIKAGSDAQKGLANSDILDQLEKLPKSNQIMTGEWADKINAWQTSWNTVVPKEYQFDPTKVGLQQAIGKLAVQSSIVKAKELTSRPTQYDFKTILEKDSASLSTSPEGRQFIEAVYRREQQEAKDVSNLAQQSKSEYLLNSGKKDLGAIFEEKKQKYYNDPKNTINLVYENKRYTFKPGQDVDVSDSSGPTSTSNDGTKKLKFDILTHKWG